MKKISIVINIVLFILLIGVSIYAFNLYSSNKELKNEVKEYLRELDVIRAHETGIGYLSIDKINLGKSFVDAVGDVSCIDKSVCSFYKNSKTSFLLAAHSNMNNNGYFRNLDKLKKGDIAEVFDNKNSKHYYQYKLEDIKLSNKSDYNVTSISVPNDTLVLLTTDKKNPEKKYLVLTFKFVKEVNYEEGEDTTSDVNDEFAVTNDEF